MYDVMGSKVIEMSEELKAIKNPKITVTKVKNSICWGVYNSDPVSSNREVVDPLIIPMINHIKDFFKKFAETYIHQYKVNGTRGKNMHLLLRRIIDFQGGVFLLQNNVKSKN